MELKHAADGELVKMYQCGNNKAFEILMFRHHSRVYNYINSYVRDVEQAKDLFQETFYKVIVNIQQDKYVENGKFISWVFRIAQNLILDYFQQKNKFVAVPCEDNLSNFNNDSRFSEKSIEEVLNNEQVYKDVTHVMDSLSPIQRAVVHLRFFEGLSFVEIAEESSLNINTVSGRMRYALKNMRQTIKDNNINLQTV